MHDIRFYLLKSYLNSFFFWLQKPQEFLRNFRTAWISRERRKLVNNHKTRDALKGPECEADSIRAITRPSARRLKYLCSPNDPASRRPLDTWYLSSRDRHEFLRSTMHISKRHEGWERVRCLKFAKCDVARKETTRISLDTGAGEERLYRVCIGRLYVTGDNCARYTKGASGTMRDISETGAQREFPTWLRENWRVLCRRRDEKDTVQ